MKFKRKAIIGVMGPGEGASKEDTHIAFELGKGIAREGWVVLSGGRNAGVMDAVSRGAKTSGGLVVGVLPGEDAKNMSRFVDIPILTGLGSARNNINVLSSDIVIACGAGLGTISEIALALKAGKKVGLLNFDVSARELFERHAPEKIEAFNNVEAALKWVKSALLNDSRY